MQRDIQETNEERLPKKMYKEIFKKRTKNDFHRKCTKRFQDIQEMNEERLSSKMYKEIFKKRTKNDFQQICTKRYSRNEQRTTFIENVQRDIQETNEERLPSKHVQRDIQEMNEERFPWICTKSMEKMNKMTTSTITFFLCKLTNTCMRRN